MKNKEPTHICANCGFKGRPVKQTKGSFALELLLWIVFLIPGVAYTIWRMTTTQEVCPKCKTPNMLPLDTPKGRELEQSFLA
ncbi:hypothetical protein H6802_02905 [Candidatus Nomurabacteria bacterium]|uniref:YqaE/Pmp3 family membrane protein n=1 Tax=candidate division WWE3 bacterium TaxID=2053526 RepID=A0A955E1F5_UNCKA|nr:hypothetical protein [candidate division WWE3 bacterium]MCB9823883.1 hypothetical protein [Candidatus Nomurabacteria bacterium]MCB9827137.1 hypothetical protein [Candidatus Nomurabacteria bacterium]MCB9827822.1 hypothetical protein [Candidatus Nomurabacteria bacterium]HXK52976.1 hypothetical protein [bacterium]